MNKRLIALLSCFAILLSSMSLVVQADSATKFKTVDVIASATTSTPEPTPAPAPAPAPKPAPTPSPSVNISETSADISRLLAFGSVGGDVKLLQTLLNNQGYNLKVDGIFGEGTKAAVEDYQGKNGLRVDGIVGPKTLAILAPIVAEVVEPVEPATPEVPAEPEVEEVVEEEEEVDAVTSASIVTNAADFEKAISSEGTWIICTLNDITFDNELVLDGEFKNNRDAIQRKIAPYTQDDDKVVLERFTITAPKLTINSPNARFQAGTFVGDIYVAAPNFRLVDATVQGNIYFTTQEAKDTFDIDEKSSVTGRIELVDISPDAVSSASLVIDEAAFEKTIGTEENSGTWIIALLKDLTFGKALTLEGEFTYRDTVQRKVALYTQDAERNTTRKFTLTVPKLFVNSPNASIQKGIFNGNIYVSTDNFKLVDTEVNGSVYFTTESAKETFNIDETSVITGEQELVEVDAITSASIVNTEEELEKAISKHGVWITLLKDDITTDKELVMEGEFRNGKFKNGLHAFDRKLALYSYVTEGSKEIGDQYTLTVPKLTVKVPNARIQEGTIEGDLYISAPGVRLINTEVIGNVYFTNQEAMDTFSPEGTYSISGVQELITE